MTSMEDLLSLHCLPERLRYETASTTTNVVSVTVVDKTGPCRLAHARALSSRLHETLKNATDWVFATDDEHMEQSHHVASDVSKLARHLEDTSVWAEDAARTQLVSGEMGESHFLMAYLVLPFNNLLRLMFSVTGLIVYWRFVGIGPGGKPDIELICTRLDGTTEKLAVCEIKTVDALTNRHMNQLLSDIRDGKLSMDGQHAFYEQGKAMVPRAQRSKSCKIAQQVTGEMYTRNVPLAILTNFENYMVLERQSGPTSPEVVHCSDIISVSSVPSRTSLHQSPLGLFLSVTLRACSLRGIWIPPQAIDLDEESYVEGMALSNRSDVDRSDDSVELPRSSTQSGNYHNPLFTTFSAENHDEVWSFSAPAIPEIDDHIITSLNSSTDSANHDSSLTSELPLPLSPPSPKGGSVLPGSEWIAVGLDALAAGSILGRPPSPSGKGEIRLQIEELRGRGRLSEAYSCLTLTDMDDKRRRIVKITNLDSFAAEARVPTHDGYSVATACRAIAQEVNIFRGILSQHQGVLVPRLFGLYASVASSGMQIGTLFEDAGYMVPFQERFSPIMQRKVRSLYKALHQAGVIHNDVEWRHILLCRTQVRLVDFDSATTKLDYDDEQWNLVCEAEMDMVNELLRP